MLGGEVCVYSPCLSMCCLPTTMAFPQFVISMRVVSASAVGVQNIENIQAESANMI